MRYKKIMMMAILLVGLLAVSSVSAADNSTSDNVSMGETTDEVVDVDDNQAILKETANSVGTFTDLANEIANATDELNLTRDYSYSDDDSNYKKGINIDKSIVINGNGFTINGNYQARAFNITANSVVLNNISFVDCSVNSSINNTMVEGGAVYWSGNNGVLANCNFMNCSIYASGESSYGYGGAVYFLSKGTVTYCNFTNNTASDLGGAILFERAGTVTYCNFTNNTASDRGGAIRFSSSGITHEVRNCNFTNNKASANGGAISFADSDTLATVTNCNFTNNFAHDGGAICMDLGTVSNCNFTNNFAYYGGAICMDLGTVSNCNFTNNSASRGGAVYFIINGTVTNCNFVDNFVKSGYLGYGVIFFKSEGNVSNCTFINNSADCGGAIYFNEGSTAAVTNCNFMGNHATKYGGAIYFYNSYSNCIVTDCTFIGNNASYRGGAVYFDRAGAVTNCTFIGNNATYNGGAVYFYSGGNVINCNFIGNNATGSQPSGDPSGGGAIFSDSKCIVTDCNFTGNQAFDDGGAIHVRGYCTVANCTFINNSAVGHGGAICHTYLDCSVVDCTFINNTAAWTGGAINMNSGTVTNCNFTNNEAAKNAGAVGLGKGDVTNCNFTGNQAFGDGGAVQFTGKGNVINCNFTGNNATNGSAIYFATSSSYANTVSDSHFLNNRANAEDLQIIKNDNNITVIFTGNDNLLNAIYSKKGVKLTFSNVVYWGANGIANTGSSATTPVKSNKEAGQNITVGVVVNGELVLSGVKVTDENGTIVLDINAGENYYIGVRHDADSYYTEAVKTISNNTKFNVNVTSQTTTNRTVNITAKSNIPNEVIKGKLLFILPNNTEITANYGGNGTWWALHTFDDYAVYEVNASYAGLDNVTINNGTIAISKANSTIGAKNKTVAYPCDVVLVTSGENCTGINESSIVIQKADGTFAHANVSVDGFIITISGLGVGNYTVYYNNTVNPDCNGAGNFTGIAVLKAGTVISAPDVNLAYKDSSGELVAIIVNEHGKPLVVNLNVNFNGKDYAVRTDSDGRASISIGTLSPGKYAATVSYKGSKNYKALSASALVTVTKAGTIISAPNVNVAYKDPNGELVAAIVNEHGKPLVVNLNINFNGKDYAVRTDSDGQARIPIGTLSPGTYTATISYKGSGNYKASTATAKVIVTKAGTVISAANVNVAYKDPNGELVAIIVNEHGKPLVVNLNINFNGKDYAVRTDSDGRASIPIGNLTPGKYTATISYKGSSNYKASTATAKVTVTKAGTVISAPDVNVAYKDPNGKLVSTITNEHGKPLVVTLNINLNGKDYAVKTDSNGQAIIPIDTLSPGKYTATISYKGSGNYKASTAAAKVTVTKAGIVISAPNVNVAYKNPNGELVATITNEHGKPLVVTLNINLNGKDYAVKTDSNGQVRIPIGNLTPGKYTATISYKGSGNYKSSTATAQVAVTKAATVITAPDVSVKCKDPNGKLVSTITNEHGKPLVVSLNVELNGKTYAVKTDSNGQATVSTADLASGTYVATISYKGSGNYKATSTTAKITVKK